MGRFDNMIRINNQRNVEQLQAELEECSKLCAIYINELSEALAELKRAKPTLDAARRVSRYDWSMPDIIDALGVPAYDDICDLIKATEE